MRALNYEILKVRNFLFTNCAQEPFCSCEINRLYSIVNENQRSKELIELFMWTWIDQVIYWVLVDDKNESCLNNYELYDKFRSKYAFPKTRHHSSPGYMEPSFYLTAIHKINLINDRNLLLDIKRMAWDENIKRFFLSMGEIDIVNRAEKEFRRDLTLRYRFSELEEKELMFLWEEDLSN